MRNKPRKWIARRIAELDPEVDYAEIVRLSSLYGPTELQMQWVYAINAPVPGIAPHVLDASYRGGTGKFHTAPERRAADTIDHLVVWLEHGTRAAATRRSVEMVNRQHAHFAVDRPDAFADIDDYVFVICIFATAVNSAVESLGLPGFTAAQRTASVRYWSELADLFLFVHDDRHVGEVRAFPDSYAAMEAFVVEYLARPWPESDDGRANTGGAIEHFARSQFPRPLRPYGRALVTSFMPPPLLRAHRIPAPSPAMRVAARSSMKLLLRLATVLPDPEESYSDRRRRLVAKGRARRSTVDVAVHRKGDEGASIHAHVSAR